MITVLFVDDEPALLDVSRIYLERSGELKVDTCCSAGEALELMNERSYDAIVCDYEMPGMDGIAFLRHLRLVGDTTPFIIFTGRGREHVVIDALNSGADFYLQKGGDPRSQFTELIHKIKQAVIRKKAEISLQITRYSVERATEQIFWLDTRGRFIYANEAACTTLGYGSDELLLLTMADIDRKMDREAWSLLVEELRQKKESMRSSRHTRKDGTEFPVEITFNYFESQGRGVIFAYSRDIHTWAESCGVSVEIRERCREITGLMPGPFMILTSDGRVEFSNRAALSLLGYSEEGLATGLYLQDITEPAELPMMMEILARAVKGEIAPPAPTAFIHKNGSRLPVLISVLPQSDSQNVLVGIFITPQKEGRLDRYRILFEESLEGMMLVSDRIVECNREACEILGYPKDELRGRTILHLSPPYQPDGTESSIALFEHLQSATSVNSQSFAWHFRRWDGSLCRVRMTLKPIYIGERKFMLANIVAGEKTQAGPKT
ncbi:MAG TPA: PAS domain S-box protein [Methanoregulaceae archaeon]|nr:PAS domain S-box protein [Methanoregulaceae archaeon]